MAYSRVGALPNWICGHCGAEVLFISVGCCQVPVLPGSSGRFPCSRHRDELLLGGWPRKTCCPWNRQRGKRLHANQRPLYSWPSMELLGCVGFHKKDIYIMLFWMNLYRKETTQWPAGLSSYLISLLKNGLWVTVGQTPSHPSPPGLPSQVGMMPPSQISKEDDSVRLLLDNPFLKVRLRSRRGRCCALKSH